jgi:hypothetical protein
MPAGSAPIGSDSTLILVGGCSGCPIAIPQHEFAAFAHGVLCALLLGTGALLLGLCAAAPIVWLLAP